MKCAFCGHEFDESQSKKGCRGCAMNGACGKLKCPNCNYEMVREPEHKILKRITRWVARRREKDMEQGRNEHSMENKVSNQSKEAPNLTVPLVSLSIGEKADIAGIQTKDALKVRKLSSLGILPGLDIVVHQRYPAFVVQVGYTQIALDREIAEEILVRKDGRLPEGCEMPANV